MISLAKKGIEVFFKKNGQPSEIILENKVFGLVNMIENWYFIRLAKNLRLADVKQVATLLIET